MRAPGSRRWRASACGRFGTSNTSKAPGCVPYGGFAAQPAAFDLTAMHVVCALLLLLSPETERLLMGPSPFFRFEGMQRALCEGDLELLGRATQSAQWDVRLLAARALGPRTPVQLVDDRVAVVRAAAIEALGVTVPEKKLIERLGDDDDAVRAAAAWALRFTQSPSRLRPLPAASH